MGTHVAFAPRGGNTEDKVLADLGEINFLPAAWSHENFSGAAAFKSRIMDGCKGAVV